MKTYSPSSALLMVVTMMLTISQTPAATINLATPVADSITVDKLNWKFDESSGTTAGNSATSGATYNGTLNQGAAPTAPSFVTGVNKPGTSGYNNAVNLPKAATTADQNSSVSWVAGSASDTALDLVDEDFTGGSWINFNSINSGAQRVIVMNRGTFVLENSFSFVLLRTQNPGNGNAYQWQMQIEVGDGSGHDLLSSLYLPVGTIVAGDWNHFGFSYDYEASPGENLATLYLNGEVVDTLTFTRDITVTNAQRKFFAGERSVSTYASSFDGKFDDLFLTSGVHSFVVPEPSVAGLFLFGAIVVFAKRSIRSRLRPGLSA